MNVIIYCFTPFSPQKKNLGLKCKSEQLRLDQSDSVKPDWHMCILDYACEKIIKIKLFFRVSYSFFLYSTSLSGEKIANEKDL